MTDPDCGEQEPDDGDDVAADVEILTFDEDSLLDELDDLPEEDEPDDDQS